MWNSLKEKVASLRTEINRQRLLYLWTWAWFFLISGAWLCIYREFAAATSALLSEYAWAWEIRETLGETVLGWLLECFAWTLIWWRVVKVVVLHGSPCAWGRRFTSGRVKRTRGSGMGVTLTYIGAFKFLKRNFKTQEEKDKKPDYESQNLLFAAIFRPHPRSDKLVRTRLEYLLVTFPFGLVFLVTESKWKVGMASPAQRAELFDEHADRFEKDEKPKERQSPIAI